MRVKNIRLKHYEVFFFVAYSIFLPFSLLLFSFYFKYFSSLYKPIVAACAVLLLIKETLCRSITRRTVWGIAILYLLAAQIIYRGSGAGQISFACAFLFAFGARNIDFKRICKVSLVIMTTVLLFVVVSALAGVIPNYRTETEIRTREYLGFRYALYGPSLLANIVFLVIYLRGDRYKLTDALALFVVFLYFFKKTDARLTFALSTLTIVVALFYRRHKRYFRRHRSIFAIMTTAFVFASIFSLMITLKYNPNSALMSRLNDFLGGRLSLGQTSLSRFGVSLFGNADIEWVGNGLDMYGNKILSEYLYVDNLYIQILQRYGIVFLIAYICLGTFSMVRCYKENELLLLLLLTVLAMHGIIDDLILYPQFNTFELLFGASVFGYIHERKKQIALKMCIGDCQAQH